MGRGVTKVATPSSLYNLMPLIYKFVCGILNLHVLIIFSNVPEEVSLTCISNIIGYQSIYSSKISK